MGQLVPWEELKLIPYYTSQPYNTQIRREDIYFNKKIRTKLVRERVPGEMYCLGLAPDIQTRRIKRASGGCSLETREGSGYRRM